LMTGGNHRYSWTRNKRSLFVSRTAPIATKRQLFLDNTGVRRRLSRMIDGDRKPRGDMAEANAPSAHGARVRVSVRVAGDRHKRRVRLADFSSSDLGQSLHTNCQACIVDTRGYDFQRDSTSSRFPALSIGEMQRRCRART
jgi:hypothetical protein